VCDKSNVRGTNAFEWNTFSSMFEASPLVFKRLNVKEIKKAASLVTEVMRCGIASRLSDLYQRHTSGRKDFPNRSQGIWWKRNISAEKNVLKECRLTKMFPSDFAVFGICHCNARTVYVHLNYT